MRFADAGLRVLEQVDNLCYRIPVVLIRRSRLQARERNAFELGVSAGWGGLSPKGDRARRRRHLHSV